MHLILSDTDPNKALKVMPEHEERVRIEGTTARRVLRVPRLIADSPAAVAGIFLGFGNLPGPMRRFCQPCLV